MKLIWDIIKYIAQFINDPLTFEAYAQCCKRTHTIVTLIRKHKEIEFLNNVTNPDDAHGAIHKIQHCAINIGVVITGNQQSGRTTLLNFIVNKIIKANPAITLVKININDILRKPMSIIHIYERILCKRRPVCIVIKGTEEYDHYEIDKLFSNREIPFTGGNITEWLEDKIDYLPTDSSIVIAMKKNNPFAGDSRFVHLKTKKIIF